MTSKLYKLITEGIRRLPWPNRPPIVVGGLGRCGTTLVFDQIIKSSMLYRRGREFIVQLNDFKCRNNTIYKTHSHPPASAIGETKILFMFGNPMNAAISASKNFDKQHYIHVASRHYDRHQDIFSFDALNMELMFDNWMENENIEFASVRYESIGNPNVQRMLSNYVGIDIRNFDYVKRASDWQGHANQAQLAMTYGRLAAKMEKIPDFKIWNSA